MDPSQAIPLIILAASAIMIVLPMVPLPAGFLAYLISMQIDVAPQDFASATELGILNALRVLLLPTVLLARVIWETKGGAYFRDVIRSPILWLWSSFILYVIVGSIASPFRLSAAKQVGYLYAYTLGSIALVYMFRFRRESVYWVVAGSVVISLGIAFVQTFLIGNPYGVQEGRFTAFTPPQSFGLYLALTFLVLAIVRDPSVSRRLPAEPLYFIILLGSYLSGSRTATVLIIASGLVLTALWGLLDGQVRRALGMLVVLCLFASLVGAVAVAPRLGMSSPMTDADSTRIVTASGRTGSSMKFRLDMYKALLQELASSSPGELLFGHGTSSAAEVVTSGLVDYRGFTAENIDANRIAHNEFLRTPYEWGIVGSLLLAGFVVASIRSVMGKIGDRRNITGYLVLWILVVLASVSALNNVLPGAGMPLGAGVMLCIGLLAATGGFRTSGDGTRDKG